MQLAVYREGRPDEMMGFDAKSKLQRRILKPVFETGAYRAGLGACPHRPMCKAYTCLRTLWVYQSSSRPPTM